MIFIRCPGKKMLGWCLLMCFIASSDCLFLRRHLQRRYGGPNPKLHPQTTSLLSPRPGSYAHKWPLHGGPRYHYPYRPELISYQHSFGQAPSPGILTPQQKAKVLNIMLDHSGHVDTDSLFPAANQIPTVFIPSNAPALAPPMVVGYGLYDRKPSTPPHAHFSMLHPSYETSFTQHHHNEISYFDNPPPQNYKYPMPYPVKNYVTSNSYSSVAHQGQNNVNQPPPPTQLQQQQQQQEQQHQQQHIQQQQQHQQQQQQQHMQQQQQQQQQQHMQQQQQPHHQYQHQQPLQLQQSASYATHVPAPIPIPSENHPVSAPIAISSGSPAVVQNVPPSASYASGTVHEVGYLHPPSSSYLPAHFSHNNPLGTLPCCSDVPWTPVESSPVATPLVREHRLYQTTRHPMMAYLPIKGHHVESESRPYITVLAINNGTATANVTTVGHKSNDTIIDTNSNSTTESLTVKATEGTKNSTSKKPTTSILMLSPPNATPTVPAPSPTKSSLPNLKNTTSFLGAFLASITESPAIGAFDSNPTSVSQANVSQNAAPTTIAPPTKSGAKPSNTPSVPSTSVRPTKAPRPPTRSPIRAPPIQSDDIFGIPSDIFPSNGGEAADAAGEGGGNGMVDIFTSFLDELANIIEQFSPTDLPGVANEVGGAASDAAGEVANAAGDASADVGGAVGDVGGVAGDVGGAAANLGGTAGDLGGAVGNLGEAGVGGFAGAGEGLGGAAEGVGGGAEGLGGAFGGGAEGFGGAAAQAGNEISASSQISTNMANSGFANSPFRQQGMAFEGMPFRPQFQANFNNFEAGESAEAEGEFFGDSFGAVSHAESEPIAEESIGIQDHFIEIPISELVPHPSFIRDNIMVNPFSEAEPHPVVTNLGRPKDFEVDHFDSQETEEEDQIGAATESNYHVDHKPLDNANKEASGHNVNDQILLNDVKESSPSLTVSNHIEVTSTPAPKLLPNDNKAIPWPKANPNDNLFLNSPVLTKAAEYLSTQSPEIISFSSTVSHWPQYGTRMPKDGGPTEKSDNVQIGAVNSNIQKDAVLSNAQSQDKSSKDEEEPKIPDPKHTPKTDITIKSEIGAIHDTSIRSNDLRFDHTDKSIELPEISTIRDYHSKDTDSEEKDNVPDAEGIPAHILPEVQSNINLDLLRTEYSERSN